MNKFTQGKTTRKWNQREVLPKGIKDRSALVPDKDLWCLSYMGKAAQNWNVHSSWIVLITLMYR